MTRALHRGFLAVHFMKVKWYLSIPSGVKEHRILIEGRMYP
jgi:hypothetical protein